MCDFLTSFGFGHRAVDYTVLSYTANALLFVIFFAVTQMILVDKVKFGSGPSNHWPRHLVQQLI